MNAPAPLQLKAGVDYQPAPILLRILAYVMDLTASVLITLALYWLLGLLLLSALSGNTFLANSLSQSMYFIGGFGYWVVVPLFMGATPAKMLFHMRIIPEADIPITPTQIILREVIGHILTVLTLGIGFLIALKDETQRGLNDRLAGTRLIQFTSPHPELYRVQDLCVVDEDGTLESWMAAELQAPEAFDSATVEPIVEPNGEPISESVVEPVAEPIVEPVAEPAVEPIEEIPSPIEEIPPPSDSQEDRSLYAWKTEESAHDRKIRAARGPTVQEFSLALRRTAEMVEEGQLAQKVLDRKREDFVQKIRTVDLGVPPDDSVREIVELGKSGLLTPKELAEVLEILRERMSSQASAD